MSDELKRRRGGPAWQMMVDVFSEAHWTRNWIGLVVLILALVAAAAAVFGQAVVPWTIYPAL